MMSTKLNLIMLAATSVAAGPLAARAQTVPATPPGSGQVEEVVVTAQKRSESVVNVPISVVALSGVALKKAGIRDIRSLTEVVPALRIDSAGAFFQPTIRGVGTALAGAGVTSNIATYVDGVYRPNPLANNFELNIDSVQVLKGPQGTLFGRNATGGAIVVTTREPSFSPVFDLSGGYGSFNTFEGSLYGSDAITDQLAVSLSLDVTHSDGWIENTVTGEKANPSRDENGQLKFLYKPSDSAKFTLIVDGYRINDPTPYVVSNYKGYSDDVFFGVPVLSGQQSKVALGGPLSNIVTGGGIELKSEFDLGFANLTSYSSVRSDGVTDDQNQIAGPFPPNGTYPLPGTPPSGYVAITGDNAPINERTYSQEFDLSKSVGNLDWVTGLYYYYDTNSFSPFNISAYGPFGPGFTFENIPYQALNSYTARSYTGAVFGDVTYNWGNWHFTAGGRYSIDRAQVNYTGFGSLVSAPFPEITEQHDFYSFTPRGVVRYSITPKSNLYVSVSTGEKAGVYNLSSLPSQRTPLQPEQITDVEGGFKTEGEGWRFETSAFHYDYKNLQVATYEGDTSFLENAKAAEIYGLDGHFQVHFADHFRLDIGGAYTHARYTDFPNAALQVFCESLSSCSPIPPNAVFAPGTGPGSVVGTVNGTSNVDGRPMERTPDFSGTASLDYTNQLEGGTLDLTANYSYQTKINFDFAGTISQPGYGVLNLRAAWTTPSERWTFSAIGRNVTNSAYFTTAEVNAGGVSVNYGEPASFMLQAAYHFR
jgi:iron complex outermembrane receptor protein